MALPDESSGYVIGVYRDACAHSDSTIGELEMDTPGDVAHWSGDQAATLGTLFVLMVGETARHAGHADIVRELIDGGVDAGESAHMAFWSDRRAKVQAAADFFR